MKKIWVLVCALSLFSAGVFRSNANVYIIVYSTTNGKTGHVGIAIDNYDIISLEGKKDTIANGTLTYFDFWPSKDDFGLFDLSKSQTGKYYKLPNNIWTETITTHLLHDKGIPHRENYPPDAILMINSEPGKDFVLSSHIEKLIEKDKPFNPRFYNCSDFVHQALTQILPRKLKIKEFMPFSFTSTPNKLCRKLMTLENVIVIKKPSQEILRKSFIRERVLGRSPFRTLFGLLPEGNL